MSRRYPVAQHCRSLCECRRGHRIASLVYGIGLVYVGLLPGSAFSSTAETANFVVSAETAPTAALIAETAEEWRATLSREWLGRDLEDWTEKCVVRVEAARARLSGDTTYTLIRGDVARWRMALRGPLDRILETLIPHEVLHTVLASHFREAVPRWADEGAALSVEAPHEQDRLWKLQGERLLREPRQRLSELFAMDSYPEDAFELRAFYMQGASVTQFLLMAGKSRFVEFITAGKANGWERAVPEFYGFEDISVLEAAWTHWLLQERPLIDIADGQSLSQALDTTASISLVGVRGEGTGP